MSKLNLDFSFRRALSLQSQQSVNLSLPKGMLGSAVNMNNTSRFEEKKVLRKLHEQEVINRISAGLKRLEQNQKIMKDALAFKRVQVKKANKREKEN